MKRACVWAALVTVVVLSGLVARADGQNVAETKAPATAPSGTGSSAAAAGSGVSSTPLAQWKHWPESDIHPDDGVVFGVAVDRITGDLFIILKPSAKAWGGKSEIGKSTDLAKTFSKAKNTIDGALLSSYAFTFDPSGKKMAFFLMYGSGGLSTDGGVNWTPFGSVKPKDFDCGVVDWDGGGKTCLALTHEAKGLLVLSNDSGATWKELGTGFTSPVGLFDAKTLISGKGRDLQRSTDGGETWTKVGDAPQADRRIQSVVVLKGVGYLATEKGLLASKDKGATWVPYGNPVDISGAQKKFRPAGPFFGANEKHIVLVGLDGVFQTADGAAHWTKVAPFPESINAGESSVAWDPVHNIIYGCCRKAPAVCCQLPPLQEPANNQKPPRPSGVQ